MHLLLDELLGEALECLENFQFINKELAEIIYLAYAFHFRSVVIAPICAFQAVTKHSQGPRDFVQSRWLFWKMPSVRNMIRNHWLPGNSEHISTLSITTVPADGLMSLGSSTSADKVMTNFESHLYARPALHGLIWLSCQAIVSLIQSIWIGQLKSIE